MAKRAGKLAKRYARALLKSFNGDLASARSFGGELETFAASFFSNRELVVSILSPMFNRDERQSALLRVAESSGMSADGVRFLRIVFERDRLAYLPEIAEAFSALSDEAANVVDVEVITARDISADEIQEIEQSVARTLKGRGEFRFQVDPGLIGGMIIRHSGKVIDGSIRGRLERLEVDLVGGADKA